jgi:hypothetical protein
MGDVLDWINVKQDKNQWQALMNWAVNLPVPYTVGNLFSSWANFYLFKKD